MKKLIISRQGLSPSGRTTIKDENGKTAYKVKASFFLFSPNRKKKIYDLDKNLVFVIRNKFWHWFYASTFIFNNQKEKIATVKQSFKMGKTAYVVEGYKEEISITGNLMSLHLNITNGDKKLGTITAKFSVINTVMEVVAENDEDMPFIMALAMAVTNIRFRRK